MGRAAVGATATNARRWLVPLNLAFRSVGAKQKVPVSVRFARLCTFVHVLSGLGRKGILGV